MAFTDAQVRQLKAKLDPRYIKTRSSGGVNLPYVEGWHVISEANRIFGFDAWDRRTISTACAWSGQSGHVYTAAYAAKVRVTVRAGDALIVREGSGTGEGRASNASEAHELALKGAETDATKRALATFGNPFGLALYDREQTGVRKTRPAQRESSTRNGPWMLRSSTGEPISSENTSSAFVDTLKRAMSKAADIELLYDLWEANIETLRILHRSSDERPGVVPTMVGHLRSCAISLVKSANGEHACHQTDRNAVPRQKIEKAAEEMEVSVRT